MYGQQASYGVQNNKRPRMDERPYGQPAMAGGVSGYGGYGGGQMAAPSYSPGPPAYGSGPAYGGGAGPAPELTGVTLLSGYERIFPCVKLRGLPFSVLEDEIRGFLECDPVDILMVKRGGRFSGEAFALLPASSQMDFALAKNKTYMGKRYVEVFRAKKLREGRVQDYYKAVTQYMMDTDDGRGPARPQPQHQQQQQHFEPGPAPVSGPYHGDIKPPLHHDAGGPAPGMAGPGPGMRGPLGGGGDRAPAAASGRSTNPADHTGVLKMRGLPFSATKQDIIGWFSDVAPLTPDAIHIVINYDGRPAGVAFVEFGTPNEAAESMVKDRAMMGSRYVELFASSREEATRTATGGF